MRQVLIGMVTAYRATLSPDHGILARLRQAPFCPQRPSCSTFALETLQSDMPLLEATASIARRVWRCH